MKNEEDKEYAREVLASVLKSLNREKNDPPTGLVPLRTGSIGSSFYNTLHFNRFYAGRDDDARWQAQRRGDDDRWQAQRRFNLYIAAAIFVMVAGEEVLRWL